MNNSLLNISKIVARVSMGVLLLSVGLFSLGFFLKLLFPESDALSFVQFTQSGMSIVSPNISTEEVINLPLTIKFLFLLQTIAGFLVFYFIAKEALTVLHSLSSLDTFRHSNVESFRKIGHLFLGLSILDVFDFTYSAEEASLTFGISAGYLIGTLISYVLAEIFKEGNRLMEENNLTI